MQREATESLRRWSALFLDDARRDELAATAANCPALTLCLCSALNARRYIAAHSTSGLHGRQLRDLQLLTLHLEEFLLELLNYAEVLLLLLTRH